MNPEKKEAINRHIQCLRAVIELESLKPLSVPTTFSGMPYIEAPHKASLEQIGENLWIFRPENPVNLIIHSVSVDKSSYDHVWSGEYDESQKVDK